MKGENILLWVIVLVLTPMLVFTGFLAHCAFGEGALFRDAPALPAEGRVNGEFYKVTGAVTGQLLGHKDFPEIKDAMAYRVSTERRPTPGSEWAEDQNAPVETGKVDRLEIGGVPVALTAYARLVSPATVVHREEGGTARKKIQFQAGPGTTLTAYGIYQAGTITEGSYERLLLVAPEKEAELLTRIAATGTKKGYVLCVVSAAILALMLGTIRAALRGPRRSPKLVTA